VSEKSATIFLPLTLPKWCSDAFEGWWGILLSFYYKFTAKSVGERMLKIDQYIAELEAKI